MAEMDATNNRFCMECGARLEEGAAFCTECGAQVALSAPASDAGAAAAQESAVSDQSAAQSSSSVSASASEAPPAPAASASSRGKAPVIVAIVIAAIAVIALVAVLLVAFGLPGGQRDEEAVVEATEQEEGPEGSVEEAGVLSPADVRLTHVYTTEFGQTNKVTFPTISCGYPDGWDVTDADVGSSMERFVLKKAGTDVTVRYDFHTKKEPSGRVDVVSVEKVWDSDFWPGYIQGSDLSSLGPCMVADVALAVGTGADADEMGAYLAVVPESSLSDGRVSINTGYGSPGFEYGGTMDFWCETETGELSDEEAAEVIAILASFSNGTTQEDYEAQVKASRDSAKANGGAAATSDYILPDSDARFYSEAELANMSLYDLYLARNEIFARHGRLFSNADLQSYFDSKPWYHGTISPSDFDEGVFNEYERRNAATMLEYERTQNSPYLNP